MKDELVASLKRKGFSLKVVRSFERVDRTEFVFDEFKSQAYKDIPLPIGHGQTISQPYTIAFMLDLLDLKDGLSILEIGSGCGYVLSLIKEISRNSKIYGVERIKDLVNKSRKIVDKSVKIEYSDGSLGLKKYGPYDRILVSASFERLPLELVGQLKEGGIIVAPVKNSIFKITKFEGEEKIEEFPGFVFVPIVSGIE